MNVPILKPMNPAQADRRIYEGRGLSLSEARSLLAFRRDPEERLGLESWVREGLEAHGANYILRYEDGVWEGEARTKGLVVRSEGMRAWRVLLYLLLEVVDGEGTNRADRGAGPAIQPATTPDGDDAQGDGLVDGAGGTAAALRREVPLDAHRPREPALQGRGDAAEKP